MGVALLTTPRFFSACYDYLKSTETNLTHVILIDTRGGAEIDSLSQTNLTQISVEDSIELYRDGTIDTVIVDYPRHSGFNRELMNYFIRNYKIKGVENLFMLVNYPGGTFFASSLMQLNSDKFYLEYIETHIVDYCNLNCRSCGHLASLYSEKDIYPLDEFKRDMCQLSKKVDLAVLRLMGGEPFLAKNLDEYVKIARKYFPQTMIVIVSNGLLIPAVNKRILQTISENRVLVEMTQYPPTTKAMDKISQTLVECNVSHFFGEPVKEFMSRFVRGKARYDPYTSMEACISRYCHFLRHGKIYKCPGDALSYKFMEEFPGRFNLPPEEGVDIYSENFLELLQQCIIYPIQCCETCPTVFPTEPWRIENNPTAEDWIH